MKWIVLLLTLLISACNSQQSKLSSIGGIDNTSTSTAPYITSVTPPADGLYTIGQTLNFSFKFSKVVEVQGTPRLAIASENAVRHADYVTGTGTDTLQFSYTIADGISDDNGITLSLAIDLNGGSIFDPIENEDARLTYFSPATWGILINASTASLVSITPPASGTYSPGQTLRFIANFSERVCGTNTPRIQLTINGNIRYATRVVEACATTMKFDYVIQVGESDNDGVQLTNVSIDLTVGPAAIKDSFSDNAILSYSPTNYPSVLIGSVAAVEQPRIVPPDDTYAIGEHIEFTLNFDKNVFVTGGTPDVHLNIGGNVRSAFLLGGSGTSSLVFRYTVVEGDLDTDGIVVTSFQYNGSSIKDSDNNNAPLSQSWPSLTNVKVDGVRPVISTFTTPSNGIYRPNGTLDFTITWSEHVNFTAPYPYLNLTLDSYAGAKQATSNSNNGLTTTYRYTVQNGDADFNGIALPTNTFTLPGGGSVTDDAGNTATLTFGVQNTSGILIAPYGVEHWYDPTNYGTFGTSAGTSLMQFQDLIGSIQGVISGSLGWNGTPKRVDFVSGANAISFTGTLNTFSYIYLVFTTKGFNPGQIMYDGIGTQVFLNVGGTMSVGASCGSCAQYYDGTNWQTTAAFTGNFGSSGLNQKKIVMMKYNGQANVDLNLNSDNGWYLNEVFLLNGANVTNYSAEFYKALQAKHPTGTPP